MTRPSTSVSFANFGKRMRTLGQAVEHNSREGVKQIARATVTTLIAQTPVKSGQAASNWQVGLGGMVTSPKLGFTDIPAARALALATIEQRQAGQNVYISNLLPYIGRLNDGYSSQAPAGFVENALVVARQVARNIRLLQDVGKSSRRSN
ncbi:hypothetical protein [Achromobacter phage ehaak_LB5]|nr:hypothetical protein [Achromobacter phage ehaak_LB5]